MWGRYLHLVALLFIACFIVVIIPVAAVQSAEQSLSGSMTRGSRFTITITGLPNTSYYVWLPGTFTMTGEQYDQPPIITDGTLNLQKDPDGGPYTIGLYQYNNGGGRTILDDVTPSSSAMSNTNYYASVTTDASGVAVVEFRTSVYTATRSYSVKVENPQSADNGNLLVEQKIYSRSASRPMINTPMTTAVVTTMVPAPVTSVVPSTTVTPGETLMADTQSPSSPTNLPTKKAPMSYELAALAAGAGIATVRRWR